ncbi:SDR family NAD(P)-dependent oxidoreductase [Sorangium sp. So ce315]|uniref:SDR family NAD(P)-dependent oxidoreductase n=1 Tax=Sorangium sp. So ce315 TaxID=3133299 RepID=UPI003F5E7535
MTRALRRSNPEEFVMEETLSLTIDNPIVRDHRVLGVHLLPGLAYIDLIFTVFRKQGHDFRSLELRNVAIFQPLVVSRSESVLLTIRSVERRRGEWRIEIEGASPSGATRTRYLTAEVHRVDPRDFEGGIDLASIRRSAAETFTLDELYARYRDQELVHGAFMQAQGRLLRTDEAIHVECGLSDAAGASAEHVMFHPALLDGSAVCGGLVMLAWSEGAHERPLALPLFYESFRAQQLIRSQCVARILRTSMREVHELRQSTLEFFDESGRKVAELRNVTSKEVRDPSSIDPRRASGAPVVHAVSSRSASKSNGAAASAIAHVATDAQSTIEASLRQLIAERLRRPAAEIGRATRFHELGLSSSELLMLAHSIEKKVGASLSPTLLFEYVTIADLAAHLAALGHFDLEAAPANPAPGKYVFEGAEPYLQDHRVFDAPALMGITHPCLAVESFLGESRAALPVELRNVRFRGGPITLKSDESVALAVAFSQGEQDTSFEVKYATEAGEPSKVCCAGDAIGPATAIAERVDVDALLGSGRRLTEAELDGIYRRTPDFTLGPLLRTADAVWVVDESTQVLRVNLGASALKGGRSTYALDPLALCACYNVHGGDASEEGRPRRIAVPLAIEKIVVHRRTPARFYIVHRRRIHRPDYTSFDATIVSEAGDVVVSVVNASIKEVSDLGALVNASFEKEIVSRYVAGERPTQDAKGEAAGVAIIGVVGRYPRAQDIDRLWQNLESGRDCITEVPAARWDHDRYYDAERGKPGKSYGKWGGFIEGVDEFDPLFFNISPRNAEAMDPQIRLFLETVWELLETAGYSRPALQARFDGNVGLYVGSMSQQYRGFGGDPSTQALAALTSAGDIANRVSNFFDLKGPSIAVDTMCSSSAMAIHMACRDLLQGDCRMAIAGGVNLLIHPDRYVSLSQAHMIGSQPSSRSFAAGDGYLPAEAVGAVLLKPLDAAIRDRDTIWAVIKSTCTNHSGRSSGYAMPDPNTQTAVIERALQRAGVEPETVSWIEAAAAGFVLADAVELTALNKAFARLAAGPRACAVGSVKSHIGHAEAASGISQLTKVLLQMRHRTLIPPLAVETPNPNLRFEKSPFYLLREVQEWKRPVVTIDGREREAPRRALIDSFGAGGSYVSLVIEEFTPPAEPATAAPGEPQLVVLSAMDAEQLCLVARRLFEHTAAPDGGQLADIAYSLQRRERLPVRLAFVARTMAELRARLSEIAESSGDSARPASAGEEPSLGPAEQARIRGLIRDRELDELGRLWVSGVDVPLDELHDPSAVSVVRLPTYPFKRRRYWMGEVRQRHPLVHREVADAEGRRAFATVFDGAESFLRDHDQLFPAVAYLEMARAAGEAADTRIAGIRNALWISPLVIRDRDCELRVVLSDAESGRAYEVSSSRGVHARGLLVLDESLAQSARPPAFDIEAVRSRCTTEVDGRTRNEAMGMPASYDKLWIASLVHSDHEALASLEAPSAPGDEAFLLDPNLGNSVLVPAIFLSLIQDGEREWRFPYTLEAFWIYSDPRRGVYVYARRAAEDGQPARFGRYDVDLVDASGNCLMALRGLTAVPAAVAAPEKPAASVAALATAAAPVATPAPVAPSEQPLLERAIQELTRIASGVIKLEARLIDPRAELARYGFDSMAFADFTNALNKRYGLELMPTVFFECPTLSALGEHLVKRHELRLRAKWDVTSRGNGAPRPAVAAAPAENVAHQAPVEPRRSPPVAARKGARDEPIAIVGMNGRFPGSASVRELWENVLANRDLIREVPIERWDWRKYYGDPKSDPQKTRVKFAGFMEDVDRFDPLFFGISPLEAQGMDPQLRLFIECAWACIEDAGYRPSSLAGSKTGVFIGISTQDYKDLVQAVRGLGVIMGLFHFMVANRVSYLLNLRGPSEPIDTACSSSLVAIHRAVGCLRSGECEAAIVGGVNVLASPDVTIGASQMGMLSEDGRCKTFDRSADGYGRGEGVAALLLKPLSRAEADGDHIYALIRGTAENHGGKATSPTAPNPLAQQDLIVAAYESAGFDARTVGYIEAHGTGTVLGDPVELNGLKGAFVHLYAAQGIPAPVEAHCGLGSLKTNIGHLEAAAGIAGVVKVLMMLRHGKMPGNIHLKEPNPYLQLEGSPFYLVKETRDWPEIRDAQGRVVPRRAGVSSFGVGGANAHVVLEEYVEPAREAPRPSTQEQPAFIVLSAKDEDRLRAQARRLLDELSTAGATDADLPDIAYTLQVGREAMEHRLAFTAATIDDVRDKLAGYLDAPAGTAELDRVYHGESKKNQEALAILDVDEDMAQAISTWVAKGKHEKLLELWTKGLSFDWARLYASGHGPRPRRVSLPTYPFARERYWVDVAESLPAIEPVLHPLAQRNTSSLEEQRFSSTLSRDAFFLSDHVIRGDKVLPGVCYLEMARAAVLASLGRAPERRPDVMLRDVVWLQPLVVDDAREVHIALSAQKDGAIEFDVYTLREDAEGEEVVHAQGRAVLVDPSAREESTTDLPGLLSRCDRSIDVARAYEALSAIGIAYGPAHRALSAVHVGTDVDGRAFVLAEVSVPACVAAMAEQYHLHPSVMDGALQASLGLSPIDGAARPALPFALEGLDIRERSPAVATVIVRPRAGAGTLQKLDIDVCDPTGRVCVRLSGFATRALEVDVAPGARGEVAATERVAAPVTLDRSELSQKTAHHLKRLLASTLKLPPERIETGAALEKYGIDSVMALKLVNQLETAFGALPKTLMFEYQSIDALAQYFIENHRDTLVPQLTPTAPAAPAPRASMQPDASATPAARADGKGRRGRSWTARPSAQRAPGAPVDPMDIAVIGMSGRYPQAPDVAAYWENLRAGKDCIVEIPPDRWDHGLYFDPEKGKPGKSYSKWGGFIDGVDEFDPIFFNISPKEAAFMDPQERLFLQCVYQTLEDAGYTREALRSYRASGLDGNVGVFVGVMYEEYQLYGAQSQALGQPLALGGSPASIANRVSYFCNFHGPSMAVDTMCSSSLMAIHLACESLKSGACELAIAGGVNVSIHPNKYLYLAQGQFASSMGRCESFGQGGDGYVPGEGVGAVLLKPLDRAVADGDHIHGVIKGTSVNHGGKTNGYTVPNPAAQAQVVTNALRASRVDPRTVSYIEAHGTGTSLGDPIEIAGLAQAFSGFTQDRQFCAIGSAKSNIGHLESAAGIAGVTKVLLQMQERMLVPSLHAEVLNPHIDFSRTPFQVQRSLEPWRRPVIERDGGSREYPRIAGISSFGAGGSNAHVILEEYVAEERSEPATAPMPEHPALVVLSARTDAALRERARQLLAHVVRRQCSDVDLVDIAYTLQIGREAMRERLALTAATIAALREKLTAYLDGKLETGAIEECYRGEVKTGGEASGLNAEDAVGLTGTWLQRGQYGKVLELWVKGLLVDWSQLYVVGARPRRVSLPGYPFARDRYWAELPSQRSSVATASHPLVHRNTSSFDGLRFSSTLRGNEFFLSDHVVQGKKVLPGVCYLEMAREAARACLELGGEAHERLSLRNVVWVRPAVVERPQEIHVRLRAEPDGEIEFEIGAADAEHGGVLAKGNVVLDGAFAEDRIDLQAYRSRCERSIDVGQCYESFRAMGLDYGPAHRGLSSVNVGVDAHGRRFVLAQVELPDGVRATAQHYVLHPSVLDSALQSLVAFRLADAGDSRAASRPEVPFALETLEFVDRSPSRAWVLARPAEGEGGGTGGAHRWNIEIGDETGRVCVRLAGLAARALEPDARPHRGAERGRGTLLLTRAWQLEPLQTDGPEAQPIDAERWVYVDRTYEAHVPRLRELSPSVNWSIGLGDAAPGTPLEERVVSAGEELLGRVQSLLRARSSRHVLLQLVLNADADSSQALAAASGLFKTVRQENPKLVGQVIGLPATAGLRELSIALDENACVAAQDDTEIRYVSGGREVATLEEVSADLAGEAPWRDGGVYLITGGAGGLGLIIAREIARKVKDATLVLAGRSRRGEVEPALGYGAKVEYRVLDVADAAAVEASVRDIVRRHGRLSGIVHSAGVLRDGFVIHKTHEAFRAVLAPKVRGAVHLDRATRDLPLDFFILFASVSGVFGNLGQSDYALANAFMDRFAERRNERVRAGARRGRTLSIDWPLWAEGGMRADEATQERMRERGFDVLSTDAGIEALYRAWRSGEPQVVALAGVREKLAELFERKRRGAEDAPPAPAPANTDDGELVDKVQSALAESISRQLKLKPSDIDPDMQLGDLGFDSIELTAFASSVNDRYGLAISPALFFEHPSVRSFARYLVRDHTARMEATHAAPRPAGAAPPESPSRRSVGAFGQKTRRATVQPPRPQAAGEPKAAGEPIAIIGMSGCFPGAPDLDAFWDNLRDGQDSITEVPRSRWDWKAIYGDPSEGGNKTLVKWGGFIDSVEHFDPLFFNISRREAQTMDPPQRLLMTHAWKAIEDAGYSPRSLAGSDTGIFVGTASSGYADLSMQNSSSTEGYHSTSATASIGPNRMSYLLDIHGPSEPVETACSSSLVAIHRAVRAIRAGECEMALAGGINVIVTPWAHILFGKAGMLSEDGRCKTFSKNADGYVRGEGVGMLVLKKLSAAERDGDHVYGLIRGTSENHGGRASSLTAPNPKAQTAVITAALREAGVEPGSVTYVETHGTGTPLGDPVEINGLKSAFAELTPGGAPAERGAFCGLGSVKTNIGHLELAAGVAGIIKVLLQLRHRTLVKSLHCEEINPYIQLQGSPFYIVDRTQPWSPKSGSDGLPLPRIAGVSSFGFGGVNAHVVLEEYREAERPGRAAPAQPALVVLSARTQEQLLEQARRLVAHLSKHAHADGDLDNIAYTLQVGRDALDHRLGLTARTIDELREKLSRYVRENGGGDGVHVGQAKRGTEASSDGEERALVERCIEQRDLPRLLELWVDGASVDWSRLYAGRPVQPRRVSLPTYPFAKERYWLDDGTTSPAQSPRVEAPSPRIDGGRLSAVLDAFLADEMDLHDAAAKARELLAGGLS